MRRKGREHGRQDGLLRLYFSFYKGATECGQEAQSATTSRPAHGTPSQARAPPPGADAEVGEEARARRAAFRVFYDGVCVGQYARGAGGGD